MNFPATAEKHFEETGKTGKNPALREQVYQYLKAAITNGSLRHGEFLDQDTICKQLNVSKTPLRDALIRLEAEGFVAIKPRKGVQITTISKEFIKSAYQIIGSIEADCINEVFDQLTQRHIEAFEKSNERQLELLKQDNYIEYYDENVRFHNIFLDLSTNILMDNIITPLRRRLYDFPRKAYSFEWESFNLETHRRFIDSIRYGNRTAACDIFRSEHWSFPLHEKYLNLYYQF